MNNPCENCIKADVCKYKEEIKEKLDTICYPANDIISITYTCKYAKYNATSHYNVSGTTAYRNDNSTFTIDNVHKDSITNTK